MSEWKIFFLPNPSYPHKIKDEIFVRSKSAKEIGKRGKIISINSSDHEVDITITNASTRKRKLENKSESSSPSQTNCLKVPIHSSLRYEIEFTYIDAQSGKISKYTKEHGYSRLVPVYNLSKKIPTQTTRTKQYSNAPKVIVTKGTNTYRLMASSQIVPDQDYVLEIGCSYGKCTQILSKYAKHVFAIDASVEALQNAKKILKEQDKFWKRDNVEFENMDPFMPIESKNLIEWVHNKTTIKDESIIENSEIFTDSSTIDNLNDNYKISNKPLLDCVFIDIGGNRDIVSVVRMIDWVQKSFTVNLIVVKSEELEKEAQLHNHSMNLSSSSDIQTNDNDNNKNVQNNTTNKYHESLTNGTILQGTDWWEKLKAKMKLEVSMSPKENNQHSDVHNSSECETQKKQNLNDKPIHHAYAHPLQAPLRLSPKGDGSIPICRYFNYHINGCSKGEECPFDHTVCHLCLSEGHTARMCKRINVLY